MRHKKRLTAAVIASVMLWQATGAAPAEILAATVQESSDNHWGEAFTCEFDASTGALLVHGEGEWPDYSANGVPWQDFRDDIRTVGMDYGITSIGESAFWGCSNLTQIDIPDSVTELGWMMCLGCSSLEQIELPDGIKVIPSHAFDECTALYSCEIPDSVETIENSAFENCESLAVISIPNSVTSIEKEAFENCTSLRKLDLPDGITALPDYMCYGCSSLTEVNIPEGVTEAGEYVFADCSNLLYCDLPESLTYIAPGMFSGCSLMTVQAYSDHITELKEYAFSGCDTMTDIILPASLTKIGEFAFEECSELTFVVIPAGVSYLERGTFLDCESLISVLILNPDCEIFFDEDRTDLPVFPPQTHLHGIAGSKIEQYALAHDYIFERYLRGDVNCDGVVDEADIELLLAWDEFQNPSAAARINADINYDNFIDEDDDVMLSYYLENGCFSDETPPETTVPAVTDAPAETTTPGPELVSGMCGLDLEWFFDPASGALWIRGTGSMDTAPWSEFASQITSVDLPDELTSFCDGAFRNCTALTSVRIPAEAKFLSGEVFRGCTSLKQFLVSEGSRSYFAKDGVLYEEDSLLGDFLVCYPAGKTGDVVIPGSVSEICEFAFDSFSGSDIIQVPGNVQTIGKNAFLTGKAVKEIWFPDAYCTLPDNPSVFADHLVIRGVSNSTAQFYAKKYGFSFVLLDIRGDVNCDGSVTAADLELLLAYFDGTENLSQMQSGNADVDNSNRLDKTDAEWLLCFLQNGYFPDEAPETTETTTTTTTTETTTATTTTETTTTTTTTETTTTATTTETTTTTTTTETTTTTTTTETTTTTTTTETTTTTTTTETTTTTTTTEITTTTEAPEVLSGICGDDLVWMLDPETEILTVYGEGAMYDYKDAEQQPWSALRPRIQKIEFSDGVSTVGAHAFEGCSAVAEIVFPNTMRTIGDYAFYQCTDLEMAVLWNQVEKIGINAFGKCTGLATFAVLNPSCAIADSKNTISDSAAIFSFAGSAAEKYAVKYARDFTQIFRGDGSLDDKVSIIDAIFAMLKCEHNSDDDYFQIYVEAETEMLAENLLDVNTNGQLTMDDAEWIARYYLMELAGYTPDWNQILQGE